MFTKQRTTLHSVYLEYIKVIMFFLKFVQYTFSSNIPKCNFWFREFKYSLIEVWKQLSIVEVDFVEFFSTTQKRVFRFIDSASTDSSIMSISDIHDHAWSSFELLLIIDEDHLLERVHHSKTNMRKYLLSTVFHW